MKLTLEIMKKMGFKRSPGAIHENEVFFYKNNKDPLTYKNVKIYYQKKDGTIYVKIDENNYPCKSVEQLMEGIFFAGMRVGRKQFIEEYKKFLEIKG